MKKIAIKLSLFILCSAISIAENRIDKATFEKLVDYANCKYTTAYIETFRTDPKEKGSIEKFDKNVKEELTSCTAENPVSFAELSNLLKNNGWAGTENKLSAIINDKKKNFAGNEMEAADAIGLLKLEGIFANILQATVNDLQKELTEKYKPQAPPKRQEPPAQQQQSTTVVATTTPYTEHSHKWFWITLIATWIILVVFAYFLSRLWNRCAKLKKTIVANSEQGSNANISMFENKLQQLDRKIGELQVKINNIEKVKENAPKEKETSIVEASPKTNIKYLKGLSGNTFSRVVDTREDNCFYKLVNEKDGTAEFEYCGTIDDARSQFNAIFDNVCDTEGSANNAKNEKTATKGKVKFADGKWIVTEKAKIKFE